MANDCLWRDATRLYKDRPVASVKKQILGVFAVFMLIWMTDAVQSKVMTKRVDKKLMREERQEFEEFKSSRVTPREMRQYMCFNRPSMMGDVFQEVVFRLLAMKWLIVEAKMNPHVANLIQALIFGFMHMWNVVFQERNPTAAIHQSVFSTVYFFYIGYLFIYTNSIFPCIVAHILQNQVGCLTQVADYAQFLKK